MNQKLLRERNASLYGALKSFVMKILSAIEIITKDGNSVSTNLQFVWHVEEELNTFSRRLVDKTYFGKLLYECGKSIKTSDVYQLAVDEIKKDDLWGSQVDKHVGNTMGQFRLGLSSVLMEIPGFILNKTEQCKFSEQYFDEEVERLESFFRSPNFSYVRITLLYGVTVLEKLHLTKTTSIEPLASTEVLELLNDGLVPPSFTPLGLPFDLVHNVFQTAIVSRFELPKIIKDDNEIAKGTKDLPSNNISDYLDDEKMIIDLLTLILRKVIKPLGSITKSRAIMSGILFTKNDIGLSWINPNEELRKTDQEKIYKIWAVLGDGTKKSRNFLKIAVRRYTLAINRSSLDDKLIDQMICAEALFLVDGNAELSYKLSHRAASLLGNDPEHKREIFKFMKDAYNLRSKVVHGAKSHLHEPDDIKKITEMTARLSTYLHDTILKMLEISIDPKAPEKIIDWDQTMF